MELRTTCRVCCGMVLLKLSGRLSVLERSLQPLIGELLDRGHRKFMLNLTDVHYIDCAGLGQLITILGLIENVGGSLILSRPREEIRKLFEITKLDCVFQIETEGSRTDNSRPVLKVL